MALTRAEISRRQRERKAANMVVFTAETTPELAAKLQLVIAGKAKIVPIKGEVR